MIVWASMPLEAQVLLDRIVGRVNGAAITLTDVQAAIALGIVQSSGTADQAAIDQMVERQLMLGEVARFVPPEPAETEVARETASLIAYVGPRLSEIMAATGIDQERIREIARQNLRIEAYLNQRFGANVQLTEEEVAQYYRIHPEEFTRNGMLLPFAEAEPLARERAGADRRATTIAQWMRDLRSRADISLPR